MKPGLSVHMMVLDPPMDRLALLVEYLDLIADEFVIVDTGSSDKDKDTMSSWDKVRIIEEKFTNFSETRNKGLEQHEYEWTLGIDPDELPSIGMYSHINAVLKGEVARESALGWLYWTKNYWGGILGPERLYHWHTRLWRSAHGRLYRPVHELVRLDGKGEEETRGTNLLPAAPKAAYLIHSKAEKDIEHADKLYESLGHKSR
jgi:hypothetical protein